MMDKEILKQATENTLEIIKDKDDPHITLLSLMIISIFRVELEKVLKEEKENGNSTEN